MPGDHAEWSMTLQWYSNYHFDFGATVRAEELPKCHAGATPKLQACTHLGCPAQMRQKCSEI